LGTFAVWVDDYSLKALPSLEVALTRHSALIMRSFARLPNPATVAQLNQYRQVAVISGKDLPHLVSRVEMATTTLKVGVIGVLPPGCAMKVALRAPGLLDVLSANERGAADRIALMSNVPIVSGRTRSGEPLREGTPGTPTPAPGAATGVRNPVPPGTATTPARPVPAAPAVNLAALLASGAVRGIAEDSPALAIASSTGGCWVLAELLRATRGKRPGPVLVAQHLDAEFTAFFAEWLESATGRMTVVVLDTAPLVNEAVYIPNGGGDLCVVENGREVCWAPASAAFVPSADRLLQTFAKAFGERAMSVVLSGMGNDGAAGTAEVLRCGGRAYCQHPSSSVVPSMPEAALSASRRVVALPPETLATALCLPH
jgi:chemotaxis response regulator CheB